MSFSDLPLSFIKWPLSYGNPQIMVPPNLHLLLKPTLCYRNFHRISLTISLGIAFPFSSFLFLIPCSPSARARAWHWSLANCKATTCSCGPCGFSRGFFDGNSMGSTWGISQGSHGLIEGKIMENLRNHVFGSSNLWINMVVVLHVFPWTHPVIRVDQTSCLISCQMDIPYDWSHHRLIIHAKSWVKSHLRCCSLKA